MDIIISVSTMDIRKSLVMLLTLLIQSRMAIGFASVRDGTAAEEERDVRHKRHLRFPFNSCIAVNNPSSD